MLCGSSVAQDAAEQSAQANDPRDDARSGVLGDYRLDIGQSVRIMDGSGNTIYNLPVRRRGVHHAPGGAEHQARGGDASRCGGRDAKAWRRAIAYQRSPPVWYLRGDEDCEVLYMGEVLGVTPCVVTPPFLVGGVQGRLVQAGRTAARRRGARARPYGPRQAYIRYASRGDPRLRVRAGGPDGETLVLNPRRSLVMAEQPCLTDGRGATVLRMPGAEAKVGMLKRGATIYWDQPGLGRLSVDVRCDSPIKVQQAARHAAAV